MPYTISVTTSSAAPREAIFEHLAVTEAWRVWVRVPWPAKSTRERAGDEEPNGVGAIRRIRPAREQVIAYEPPRLYAYTLVSGLPLKNYRGEVTLEPADHGTAIVWRSRFDPVIPGTGRLFRSLLTGIISLLSGHLARHCEQCRPGCPAHTAAPVGP